MDIGASTRHLSGNGFLSNANMNWMNILTTAFTENFTL